MQKMRSSMSFNIIGAIVLSLVALGLIVSSIGYINFTNVFKKEYSLSTYHMADTATTLVNGDHIDAYLAGEEIEEHQTTQRYLDGYCKKMSVSLVYVIQVDRSDYGRFVSIFNSVNNAVDDSNYTPWELGHARDTTDDEYRQKYQALYEKQVPYETVYRTNPADGSHPHITTMVPVMNSAGDVSAILCMQRPIRELQEARRPYLVSIAIATVLLALLASVFVAVFVRRQFVAPIRKVSDEATRFARENIKGTPLGAISTYEELACLAESIDTMETDMATYIENLTSVTAEKERIDTELALARSIQENSIPNIFPAFPERPDFDIHASMTPAKEVGGDFYNFFLIDDDHLALMIGDVSGKGVPAALFMMVTNILLSERARAGNQPAEVLAAVNNLLCNRNKLDMFVTVWLGVLELSSGTLVAANAGHEYPAIKRVDGAFELLKDKHGLVLGCMSGMTYQQYELQLEPGDKLFVYTDGAPEAINADYELFGTERMVAALNGNPDGSPQQLLESVSDAVQRFAGGAEQFDDLTMLCVEYRGCAKTARDGEGA